MTIEELIEMLNILFDNAEIGCADITVIKHVSFDSFKFVLVQAINALEQEPCDDAIGRSVMLDAIGHGTTYTSEDLQRIIKGLPSVNPQPCGDAISRQAVDEYIAKLLSGYLYDEERTRIEALSAYLWDLPSVKPQYTDDEIQKMQDLEQAEIQKAYELGKPKTGHWIDDKFGSKCSCCNIYTHLDRFDMPMKFRYCSMCGAKMVEPQESEVEE